MPICGSSGCDCAFKSSTLNISNVDGVITIEQAEFTDITELQNDVAIIFAALDDLPDTYVDVIGDTMSGTLVIDPAGASLRCQRTGDTPFIELVNQDGSRTGYIQGVGNVSPRLLRMVAEAGMDLQFLANGAHRMSILSGGTLVYGKTAPNTAVAGVEIFLSGPVQATRSVASGVVFYSNRISSGDANGAHHFTVASAGTTIGSITRATASTVAFNTSSDEELKTNIVEIDDELAEWIVRVVQPYLFEFTNTPGDVHPGYIAQRVAAMWPESIALGIVRPGHGDINARTWDADGNETTPPEVWEQWSMDYSKMVPVVHAGVQNLFRKVDALTARVEALEAR